MKTFYDHVRHCLIYVCAKCFALLHCWQLIIFMVNFTASL